MKKIYILLFVFYTLLLFGQQKQNNHFFYENKGQIIDQNSNPNPEVKYLFNSPGLNVQIKSNGFSYDVYEIEKKALKKKEKQGLKSITNQNSNKLKSQEYQYKSKFHRVDIDLINSNKNIEIIAEGKSSDYENYYNLAYKPEGVERVHRYQRVIYKNVYNNVDLVFFKPEDSTKTVEYNFLVHPGGKISDIKMKFEGAKTKLKNGKLAMALRFGEMQENIPNSWIEHANSKQTINVGFKDLGNQSFGFDSEINSSDKTIVIDPVPTRIWGSYYGGNLQETEIVIKLDPSQNLTIGGITNSTNNIATSGTYETNFSGPHDAYLTQFDPQGTRLWGSYFDKNFKYDIGTSIDFDQNSIFFLVRTLDTNEIATVYKLNYAGQLQNQKRLNNNSVYFYDMLIKNNHIFLGGTIRQSGNTHAYIEKFDINLNFQNQLLINSSTNSTNGSKVLTFADNKEAGELIYVVGETRSASIQTKNAIQNTYGGDIDLIILAFTENLDVEQVSYLGGPYQDKPLSCYYKNGILKIFYRTWDFINFQQGNVIKYNSLQKQIISNKDFPLPYTQTFFGYFDNFDNLFVTIAAYPNQPNITTPDAYMTNTGSIGKAAIMLYDNNEEKKWGTFYGGDGYTNSALVVRDNNKNIYVVGGVYNSTTGIATPGAYQSINYERDNYIVKFTEDCSTLSSVSSNSPICIGQNIELKASGGTNYTWTGPNGFTSTLQNPTINNANSSHSGVYTCTITGSSGCDGSYTVNVFVGDNEKPIPDIASLPKIIGDCSTVVSNIPTATDKCKGKITATTTDPLTYKTPGLYTITWTYNDGNGNTETQTQQVEITDQPKPTANLMQAFCAITQPKISDIQVTGTGLKWYDIAGTLLPNNTLLTDNTKYYVSQNISGCESSKLEILVKLDDSPTPTAQANQSFCIGQNPTLASINITGQNIKWYNTAGVLLAQNTALIDGQTYYATQAIAGCESTSKTPVSVQVNNSSIAANNYQEPAFCNDTIDDFKIIDLTNYETKLINNTSGLQFTYYDENNQLVTDFTKAKLKIGHNLYNVKIENAFGCSQWFNLEFNLQEKPKITLQKEIEFCEGLDAELDAGNCTNCQYYWNTGETSQIIKTKTEGTYTVTVTTKLGCSNAASVVVKKAKMASIQNIIIENNHVTVILSEPGDYLYSVDGTNWQTSNEFNLNNATYILYVKTKAGCLVDQKNITIFSIPNAFSPNADGINDTWKIEGLENYPNTEIIVIDRYGQKVLNTKINKAFEWDGKFNGRVLPTGTYWYMINLSDNRSFKGFLLLKNRN